MFFYNWEMERPNTVAGLIEKRRELVARLTLARDEVKALTCGIDAIDVVLKLFAPEIDGRTAKPMRLPIPHAAGKGCSAPHWSCYASPARPSQAACSPNASVKGEGFI